MASYTIEDIELIRRKSGIGYQEAVALLDYHNGDVTRALIDLERNGKLKKEAVPERAAGNQERSVLRTRVHISNGDETIINLPLLFMLGVLLFSPWVVIGGVVLCLMQGYQINIRTQDNDNRKDSLERMVRSAATSVKNTVSDIAREINQNTARNEAERKAAKEPVKEPVRMDNETVPEVRETPEEIVRDLEDEMNGHSAPVLQVPVRVESQEGSVRYEQDGDGYGMATVE